MKRKEEIMADCLQEKYNEVRFLMNFEKA